MISETRPSDFRMPTVPPSEKPVSSTRVCAHAQRAPQLQSAGEIDHRAAVEHGAPGFRSGEGRGLGAERLIEPAQFLGRDEPADDALALVGLEAVDAHVARRQPVPDRQQQAGDDVELAVGEFRHLRAFGLPQRRELALRWPRASASGRNRRAISVSRAIGRTRRVRGCT